jgi:hypothetical protein
LGRRSVICELLQEAVVEFGAAEDNGSSGPHEFFCAASTRDSK